MVDLLARRKSGLPSKRHNQPQRIAVNQSRVKSWRLCHRQHWYKFEEQIQKKVKSRPLMFGSIVHEMLEAHANGDDPWDKLEEIAKTQRKMFRKEVELYGNIVEDITWIMSEYFKFWPTKGSTSLRPIRVGKQKAEHVFEIELERGLIWKGKVDMFAKWKENLKALVEHKTMKKEWPEDERWRNLQSLTYRRASKLMGWPIPDGTLWDYILSKPPTKPQLTTKGILSKREIITLPITVRQFMKTNDLKPKDVAGLMQKAEENLGRYFQRIFTPANDDIEQRVFDDFIETVYEIAEDHDRKKARNIGKHCSWCDFELLCRTSLTGGDEDWVKSREYENVPEPVKATGIEEE